MPVSYNVYLYVVLIIPTSAHWKQCAVLGYDCRVSLINKEIQMSTRKEFNMSKIRLLYIIGEIVVLCVGVYLLMQEDVRIALFYWFMLIYMKQRSLVD